MIPVPENKEELKEIRNIEKEYQKLFKRYCKLTSLRLNRFGTKNWVTANINSSTANKVKDVPQNLNFNSIKKINEKLTALIKPMISEKFAKRQGVKL